MGKSGRFQRGPSEPIHDGARGQPGTSEGHENSRYQANKRDCEHLTHQVNTGSGLAGQVVPASYPSHAAEVPWC